LRNTGGGSGFKKKRKLIFLQLGVIPYC